MMLKYSIITPSYNQAEFLERTILSILNQNYENFELIIIDGGSTDGSVDIIKKYQNKIAFWVSEKDRGQSHAFNKGLQIATGDIIGWINSDDIYYPGAFSESSKIFIDNSSVDIVFSNYNFIDANDKVIRLRKEIPFDYNTSLWTKDCYHANCAGFFRRKCFNRCGGLREDLHYGMDQELYLRFSKNNCRFKHINKIWGAYRFHSLSKSMSGKKNTAIEAKKIFKEYSENVPPLCIYPKMLYYNYYRKIKKLLKGCYF